MKGNELVWRTLADHAINQVRSWDSYADLAFLAGVPTMTAHLATRKLVDIGAIQAFSRGGFSVISLEKIITLLSAWRNLEKDTIAWTSKEFLEKILEGHPSVAMGGSAAAVHWLGGNTVADYSDAVVYLNSENYEAMNLPESDQVRLVIMDERAALEWQGFTSPAQTIADLFATPGWQASEFRRALHDKYLGNAEWDRDYQPTAKSKTK